MGPAVELPIGPRHVALGATALGVGVLSALHPALGVVAAVGLVLLGLAVADLTLGVCLFTFISFVDLLPGLAGPTLSLSKILGLVLVFSWLAAVATGRVRANLLWEEPALAYLLVLLVLWAAATMLWADQAGGAVDSVFRYAQNAVLLVIVYSAVRSRRDLTRVLTAFVAGVVAATIYGYVSSPLEGFDARLSGARFDPNELAAVLVAGFVVSAALAAASKRLSTRLLALGTAAFCAAMTLPTLSRGGLVALAFVAVAGAVTAGRWRGKATVLGLVVALAASIHLAAFAPSDARERVTTLGGGTGRVDLWTVGWRMVEAHPLEGVGAGNFQTSSVKYLLEPGRIERSDFFTTRPKVAHNLFLQILAELGLVGLALAVAIMGRSVAGAIAAVRASRRANDAEMEALARAIATATASMLVAFIFVSGQFNKQLWLLLALGAVLPAVVRGRPPRWKR